MSTQFQQTLTSFSGSDLVVFFGPRVIGELQQISWGIKREKAPVFTLGSSDPRSFSRGKRGIGGSLVFAQFNRDAIMEELVSDSTAWAQIAPPAMFTAAGNIAVRGEEKFREAMKMAAWNDKASSATPSGFLGTGAMNSQQSNNTTGTGQVPTPAGFAVLQANNIWYADMIPPFDATLTFANEYGNAAFQKIYDIDIMDESSGVSVDTIVMERQMSYVARRISPLMEGVYNRTAEGIMTGDTGYADA
jgi:hypothetical protein